MVHENPTINIIKVVGNQKENYDRLADAHPHTRAPALIRGPDLVGKVVRLVDLEPFDPNNPKPVSFAEIPTSGPYYVTACFPDMDPALGGALHVNYDYHICDIPGITVVEKELDKCALEIPKRSDIPSVKQNYVGTRVTMTSQDIATDEFTPNDFEPFEFFLVRPIGDDYYRAFFYKGNMPEETFNQIKQTCYRINAERLH